MGKKTFSGVLALAIALACGVPCVAFSPPPLLIVYYEHPLYKVERISVEGDEVRSSVLLEDVAQNAGRSSFQCAQSGRFIYRSSVGTWYVGDAKSGETPVPIPASLVPDNPDYAAVSNRGERIVWTKHRFGNSGRAASLTLTDLREEVNYTIPKEGLLLHPAWSPDDAYIAYYHGPPGAEVMDGFTLMRLDPDADDAPRERELAPPSMWTRLTPVRDRPPEWSPDGRRLFFEARYDPKIPPPWPGYHVDAAGREPPKRSDGFMWYRDSDHMLLVIERDRDGSEWKEYGLAVLDLTRSQDSQNPMPLPVTIPLHSVVGPPTNDGKYVVYRMMVGPVSIVDLETGVHKKVFEPEGTCTPYWIQ
jgi:hypothetical protein